MTEHRVAYAAVFDAEARKHDEVLHAAASISATDRVLDVGCGTGQSTRTAARAASAGSALGVDISAALIAHARRLTTAEGLPNVAYDVADAGAHPFPAGQFDACISRFGTMFFPDPHAAFVNIARSLRPDGRLALLVWQREELNEWSVAIDKVLGVPPDPQPFSLGDPDVVHDVMRDFAGIELIDVHAPVRYGPDAATAYDFVLGFRGPAQTLAALDTDAADAARARLRELVTAHETPDGVLFDSRAWVITARRR